MFDTFCMIVAYAGATVTFMFVLGPILPDWFRYDWWTK